MQKLITLLLLIFTQIAIADQTIDRYGMLPEIQKMVMSPNGERVAFRLVDSKRDLISIVSMNPPTPLSSFGVSNVKPRNISFIDENNLFLSIAETKNLPGFSGDFEMSLGTTYNIKKKKYSQLLTPGENDVYAAQSSLDRIIGVSPDGKYVYMPAHSGEPTYVMGQQVEPPMSLFKVQIGGKGRPRVYKRGKGNALDYFVAQDGRVLARETYNDSNDIHSLHAYHGKKSVEVFSEKTPYPTKSFIGVSADEKHIYILDSDPQTNRLAIYTLALDDGKIEGPIHQRNDADVVDYIADRQRKLLGLRYSGFTPSYHFFDPDLNQRVKTILGSFPNHSVWIHDISHDHHILVRVEGPQAVGDYYLFPKGQKGSFIISARSNISDNEIHPVTPISFSARDGLKIPTLITVPRGKIDDLKNLPAIMMPHGGPASFDSIGFDFMAQALAQQGYLVIQPQFRGSMGFGIDHQTAGYGEWGRKALDDLTDALGFFEKQGIIDPSRVCIVGASYGGYSALAGGAFTPDRYKCVVSINGIGNLSDLLNRERSERGRTSSSLAFWQAQILGFDGTDFDIAKQRSPELAASAFKAPVLLIHSDQDQNVHPRQSISMYRALKKANKTVKKVELKGEDHYLSNGKTRLQALKAIVEFVNKHI